MEVQLAPSRRALLNSRHATRTSNVRTASETGRTGLIAPRHATQDTNIELTLWQFSTKKVERPALTSMEMWKLCLVTLLHVSQSTVWVTGACGTTARIPAARMECTSGCSLSQSMQNTAVRSVWQPMGTSKRQLATLILLALLIALETGRNGVSAQQHAVKAP